MTDTERRQQILQAALRVFAERGFHLATIKHIAKEAQLKSPALIYWYFENKEQLLQAVLMELTPLIGQVTNPAELSERPPREVLTFIAENLLSLLENPDAIRLARVFFAEALRETGTSNTLVQMGPALVLAFLVPYLDQQIALGRLRPHNTSTSARAFIGALMIYILSSAMFTELKAGLAARHVYIQQVIDMFFDGLAV